MQTSFRCYYVERNAAGQIKAEVKQLLTEALPTGEVVIAVEYSSVNYKDGLAATGHPGVAKELPHIPGVDAVGVVVESKVEQFQVGDSVLVTGYQLGAPAWGGWSERISVPAAWVVPLPLGLSKLEAMAFGTAGFTAARSVMMLKRHGITPDLGPVVVTGATGGVGSLGVRILTHLGYEVIAVTGKPEFAEKLQSWGACEICPREAVDDPSGKPLLQSKFAGAIDTVGGNLLTTLLKSTQQGACVTACGLVAGTDLAMTVYPFILRGVALVGIDSALTPYPERLKIWEHLAGDWKVKNLMEQTEQIGLEQLTEYVEKILAGTIAGRTIVQIGSK